MLDFYATTHRMPESPPRWSSSLREALPSCLELVPWKRPHRASQPLPSSEGSESPASQKVVFSRHTQSALVLYSLGSRAVSSRFLLFMPTQIVPFCYSIPHRSRHLSTPARFQSPQQTRCKIQGYHWRYIFSAEFLIEEVWSWRRELRFHVTLDYVFLINRTWDN